jgi:hypothetical protein
MPYMLLSLAAIIALAGITKLQVATPHPTPWRSLVVWAVLFGAGVAMWAMSAHRG